MQFFFTIANELAVKFPIHQTSLFVMKIIGLVFLCWVIMSPKVLSQAPVLERGPYLQMAYAKKLVPNGSIASVTIRWQTDLANVGRVVYNSYYEGLDNGGSIVEEPASTRFHKIVLTNLNTDQKYYYSIGTAGANLSTLPVIFEKSVEHFFTTPPPPGSKRKVKMWVIGDFAYSLPTKVDGNRQDSTIAAMKDFMIKNNTGPMDMWLWLGDNAYEKGEEDDYQKKIFDKGRGRYDWMFRKTAFYATPGNHDYYDRALTEAERDVSRATKNIHYYSVVDNFKNGEGGGEPSGTEAYYSYDYGNVHCISLDSYGLENLGDSPNKILIPTSNQYIWLKKDLEKARANKDINWVIVFTHYPPFSGGTHDSDVDPELIQIRDNLVPLLDQYKVDLVLSGHSHDYQRTRLMRGLNTASSNFVAATHTGLLGSNAQGSGKYDGTPNSCFYYKTSAATQNEGVIYAVNGGGGHDEGPNTTNNKGLVQRLMASTEFTGGSMYIEVENKRLTAKFIAANKKVLDQFTIFKDTDSFTIPVTNDSTRIATCECTEDLNQTVAFTHYVDSKANLLLSINKHGINIGKVGVPPFEVKLSGAAGKTNAGAFYPDNYVKALRTRSFSSNWRVMNRYWTLKPATELTSNQQVTVRHYYRQEDMSSLRLSEGNVENLYHQGLRFYKINSVSTNYDIDPTHGVHNTIKGATAYNGNGIWLYDNHGGGNIQNQFASTVEFKWRNGNGEEKINFEPEINNAFPYFSGEFVVGKLNGGGGIGGQVYNQNPTGARVALYTGASWSYYAKGSVPPDNGIYNWKGGQDTDELNGADEENNYDSNSKWANGLAPFGYSPNREDGERTLLPSCSAELNCYVPLGIGSYFKEGCVTAPCPARFTTAYFRNKNVYLTSEDYSYYKSFIINCKRDDGVIIYINGKELLPRDPNMPKPPRVIYDTTLATNAVEYEWNTVVVPNDGKYFRKGSNTIAVELHQNSTTSSDTHFDLTIAYSPDVLTSPVRLGLQEEIKKVVPENTLYPNPTNGIVYFSAPLTYETIKITDSRGVVLRYISKPGVLNDLDITDLPAGVLILSNQNNGRVLNYKIVKSK